MVLTGAALAILLAGRAFTLEDAVLMRTVRELAAAPGGRSVAYTVREADLREGKFRTSLWWSPAGGSARPLTFGAQDVSGISFSPDGGRVGFLARRGERAQAWALPVDGGEARRAVVHDADVAHFAWAPDGKRVLYLAPDPETREERRRREEKDDAYREGAQWRNRRLWVGDEGGAGRALTPPDRHVEEASWSADGRSVAVVVTPTPEADSRIDARLAVIDVGTGSLEEVPGGDGAALAAWSPEGRTLAFTRPFDGRDFARRDLYLWSPGTAPRNVSAALDRDVEALDWTDARTVAVRYSPGARSAVAWIDTAGAVARRWEPGFAVVAARGAADQVAYVSGEGPPEVFVTTPAGPRRLGHLNAALAEVAHPRTEVMRWRTDAGDVEGVLFRPATEATGPRPLVVIPHGGPRDHTPAAYDPMASYLAAKGYLVLRPNFRGSTGYGDAFARRNAADWGDGPYRDVMAGVDALVGSGAADSARLFVYGWSYGGYLVNWIVTHTSRFRAAAGGAGVADLRMQYVLSDARRWRFDYFRGTPFSAHRELYARESPITYVEAARTPTLLLHGAEDVRVPLAQGTMMYRALRDNGVTAELVVYPREGHTFAEPRHVLDRLRRVEEWFARH